MRPLVKLANYSGCPSFSLDCYNSGIIIGCRPLSLYPASIGLSYHQEHRYGLKGLCSHGNWLAVGIKTHTSNTESSFPFAKATRSNVSRVGCNYSYVLGNRPAKKVKSSKSKGSKNMARFKFWAMCQAARATAYIFARDGQ